MSKRARAIVAKKVRLLRFLRGWSQEQLAAQSGLHRTYVSAIERGARNIGLDNLERLADAFGLNVSELFDSDNVSTPPRNESCS